MLDTLSVIDNNKDGEVNKFALWHKYENLPDIVYINTESEDKKILEVNVRWKDIIISTSNITYAKNKEAFLQKHMLLKKAIGSHSTLLKMVNGLKMKRLS